MLQTGTSASQQQEAMREEGCQNVQNEEDCGNYLQYENCILEYLDELAKLQLVLRFECYICISFIAIAIKLITFTNHLALLGYS